MQSTVNTTLARLILALRSARDVIVFRHLEKQIARAYTAREAVKTFVTLAPGEDPDAAAAAMQRAGAAAVTDLDGNALMI